MPLVQMYEIKSIHYQCQAYAGSKSAQKCDKHAFRGKCGGMICRISTLFQLLHFGTKTFGFKQWALRTAGFQWKIH